MLSGDFKELDTFSSSKRNTVIKSLIALSKFLGIYREFKTLLSSHGIKFARVDCFNAFLRILNNNNRDIFSWFSKASQVLRPNEQLFLKFALFSGLRKSEAINSFNLIISLFKEGKLGDYFNEELSSLEHFRFKHIFLRGKKNSYITFLPKEMVLEIGNSQPVSYEGIRKRLLRNGLRLRINELRDCYATFMLRHGLIREEIDILQGRIPQSLFVRSYWSPSLKDLKQRVLEALVVLKDEIKNILLQNTVEREGNGEDNL